MFYQIKKKNFIDDVHEINNQSWYILSGPPCISFHALVRTCERIYWCFFAIHSIDTASAAMGQNHTSECIVLRVIHTLHTSEALEVISLFWVIDDMHIEFEFLFEGIQESPCRYQRKIFKKYGISTELWHDQVLTFSSVKLHVYHKQGWLWTGYHNFLQIIFMMMNSIQCFIWGLARTM